MGKQTMSPIKKKFVVLYFEFMQSQDLEKLEHQIRRLSRQRKFPAFRKLIPMVHYKNLRPIVFNQPLVMNKDELEEIKSE